MSYGRNFEFRVDPRSGQRAGRFVLDAETLIGAAVEADGTVDADGRLQVTASALNAAPPPQATGDAIGGILVYEDLFVNYAGETASDKINAPAGASVQVVSGKEVKVALRNDATTTMVAGIGTLAVGEGLTPAGDGTWIEDADVNNANSWILVTFVDATAGVVEGTLTF